MRLLLDTHALLWWLDDNPTLSRKARLAISNPRNAVFVSAVSVWEIVLKKKAGKLRAPEDLESELGRHHFQALPVTIAHAQALEKLPDHHADPFDRMLIAQAQSESLSLVTRDAHIRKYQVNIIEA